MLPRKFSILLIALCLPIAALCQKSGDGPAVPVAEVSGTYTWLRTNLVVPTGCCFGVNGGTAGIAFNFNRWAAIVGEFGAYHAGNVRSTGRDLSLFSYMAGPRLMLRRESRLMPFAQVLLGGGHAGGSLYSGTSGLGANGGFAMAAGGGLDVRVSNHVSVRLIQADYFLTTFKNGTNDRQNNLRLGGGVVFGFGE